MNKKFINGTIDIMFKTLLRSESNKDYLSYIVSEITGIDKEIILENIKFNPPDFMIENKNEKKKVSDLIIELELAYINLEMNKNITKSSINKNVAYKDKLNVSQYKSGKDYSKGKLIIQINFDMKRLDGNKIIYKWITMEEDLKINFEDNKETYTVDLVKIREKCYNVINKEIKLKELSLFERCMGILVMDTIEDTKVISACNEMLERVVKQMEELNNDYVFIGMYDYEEEQERMMNSMKSEGLEEGLEQGIEKGIEQGRTEGINSSKIEIAKNMLKNNIDINIISKCTNLSIEEIENLK